MAQVRPALTVDVGLAQGGAGRAPTQAARAAVHQARSAQAPRTSANAQDAQQQAAMAAHEQQQQQGTADGFSSDEDGDGQDAYAAAQRRLKHGASSVGARATRDAAHGTAANGAGQQQQQQRANRGVSSLAAYEVCLDDKGCDGVDVCAWMQELEWMRVSWESSSSSCCVHCCLSSCICLAVSVYADGLPGWIAV